MALPSAERASAPRYTYDPQLIRDDSSGRIHRYVRETDALMGSVRLLSDERCQKDQSGDYTAIAEAALADVDHEALCGNCFRG